MRLSPYQVGIDFGTTYSAAAVCRPPDPRPRVVPLGTAADPVASLVLLAPDGRMLAGEAAHRRAVSEPRRVVRGFKRRIGDSTPLVVDGVPVPAEDVAARYVRWLLDQVAHREGGPADRIAVSHPVGWGPHKRTALARALHRHGVPEVRFLPEPTAAAVGYAAGERVGPGGLVAVYDLGGGTFDAAVVRMGDDGDFTVVGRPTGLDRLGGMDFDQAVFDHVRRVLGPRWPALRPGDPAAQSAVAGLRRECTAAKEALSADTEVMVPVMLPGLHTQVRIARGEFEDMIRPALGETLEALQRTIRSTGHTAAELDAVLLVGGSTRIPLVAQLVSAETGRAVDVDTDPRTVIAAGAAVAARGRVAGAGAGRISIAAAAGADRDHAAAGTAGAERDRAHVGTGGGASGTGDTGPIEVPPSPPLELGPVVTTPRGRDRRMLAALAAGAVALAAVAAGVAEYLPQRVSGTVEPGTPAHAEADLDPWTGTVRQGTTLPGTQRPDAVAAEAPPGPRTQPRAATPATPAAPGPTAAPAPAPAPAPTTAPTPVRTESSPPPPPPDTTTESPPPPPPPDPTTTTAPPPADPPSGTDVPAT